MMIALEQARAHLDQLGLTVFDTLEMQSLIIKKCRVR